MSTTSYIDHFYLNYCPGEDMDTADDYSVAMLDMANSDFRDEYTNSLPKNDQFLFYQDADATIYDARVSSLQDNGNIDADVIYFLHPFDASRRAFLFNAITCSFTLEQFLEKITLNFPQYKHIIDTIGPHDHKKIKETYNSILDYHRRQQATKIAQDRHRHALKERRPRERIISVFEGSYDERTMNDEDDDDANVYGEDACVFSDDEQDMVEPAAMDTYDQSEELDEASEEDGEDPDYIDKSYQRWLRTSVRPGQSHKSACSGKTKPRASRASPSPYVEQSSPPTPDDDYASDDDNDVPALIPDAASSPELQYIATPIASPTPRVRNAEPKDKLTELPGLPGSHAEKNIAGAGKSKVTSAGYFVTSDDLIVASWGSENGRTCRSFSNGGFECSCSHRTATMGDMTRHWLSKRHSDAAFGCKGCGRVYTRDDALKRHMRRSDECARRARRSG
ncbi:hypothetical protein JOM56_015313 [Amanita muscaria]